MLGTWVLCGALLGAAVVDSPETAELIRLEGVWNDAHVHGDAEALDRLWDPDLVVTVPKMPVFTRAEALEVRDPGECISSGTKPPRSRCESTVRRAS